MIALYILAGLILLVTVIAFLPISIVCDFDKDFKYKVHVAGFKVYPKEKKRKPKTTQPKETTKQGTKDTFWDKLTAKRGFSGAIREIFSFAKDCILPIKQFLKFLKFRNVRIYVGIVGADAAATAIEYGEVCTAVYPLLSFVEGLANVKYKKVDVRADFEGKESRFECSFKIKAAIIFVLIFMVKIFKEYKKFSVRNGLQ